jgi:hypothetical protein
MIFAFSKGAAKAPFVRFRTHQKMIGRPVRLKSLIDECRELCDLTCRKRFIRPMNPSAVKGGVFAR